jgi:hypothetical protein
MIDWWGLAHNALWVVGLAVILSACSMASYQAQRAGVRLRQELSRLGFQVLFDAGMTLVCLGLLFSARTWWQQALWGLLALVYVGQVVWLKWRRARPDGVASVREGAPPPQ